MKKDRTTKETDYIVGTEICNARIGKGISRSELLGKLCKEYEIILSEYTIQAYELGRRSISPSYLLPISKILDLDLNKLRETVLKKFYEKKSCYVQTVHN